MKEKESEAQMAEKTTRHNPFEDKIPEEVQQLLEEKQQEILDGTLEIPVVDFAP